MQGIILAGGKGTRMLPATRVINKNMIPILNVPLIVYGVELLKKFGITKIMIVSGGDHIGSFADFLGDGSEYGVDLTYKVQGQALGISHALSLARDFIPKGESFMVSLADNVFDLGAQTFSLDTDRATIFLKEVSDPRRYGVASLDGARVTAIEEKPTQPKSNYAVTGLYAYPYEAFSVIDTLKPSARGEYEVTDLNNHFVNAGRCDAYVIDGFWSDAGTPDSLLEVMNHMHAKRPEM